MFPNMTLLAGRVLKTLYCNNEFKRPWQIHGCISPLTKAALFTVLRSRNRPIIFVVQENISPVISQFLVAMLQIRWKFTLENAHLGFRQGSAIITNCLQTKSNKMQQCIKILFHIYMTLTASSNYTSNNPPRMQNQRLLVQFKAPDDGRCVARNMLSFI